MSEYVELKMLIILFEICTPLGTISH